MLIDAFKLFPDKTLVFKFHPETPENDKKKLQNKYGSNNTYFLDKIDLNKLIYYSMGLLAVSSTCIFHAVKSKKPVVIIHVDYFFPELLPLIKQTGCFKIASTPPELVTIISKLDNAKQKKLYLSNQAIIKDLYFSKQCCPVKLIKKLTDRDK